MLTTLVLAAASCSSFTVVDASGAPVVGATVTIVSSTNLQSVRVTAPGYPAEIVMVRNRCEPIVLKNPLPVISSIRVATGSPETLHALPVPASFLDRTAISLSPAPTTDALLRQLPGFDRTRSNSAFTNYGQLRVSFSGAGNDRGAVFVDGIPAQDGFGGQIDWLAYPPNDIIRAEILRGAGSALYGPGAVGGVLNLDTLGPSADSALTPQTALHLSAGTQDWNEEWFNARAPLATKLTASLSAQQQRMAYFDLPPAYQSPIDTIAQSISGMIAARLRYAASPDSVFEAGVRAASDVQQEGRPNYSFSRRLQQYDLRYFHPAPRSLVTVYVYARNAFIVNLADQYPANPGVPRYTQNVPTSENGILVSWSVDSPNGTFALRADQHMVSGATVQYGGDGTVQSSTAGRQELSGLAVQQTFRGPRSEVVTGLRFDRADFVSGNRSDSALSPRLAARYDFTKHLAIRASAGAGFRPPYLNELIRGFFIGNVNFEPHPSLVPERSSTLSTGLDWGNDMQHFSLDALHTVVNDAIMFQTIDPTHQQRSNVAQTQTSGATLTYLRAAGGCRRLSLSLTDQFARVTRGPTALIENRLQYVPQTSATVAYDDKTGQVVYGVQVSYLGQTYANDLNTQPLGTAVLVGGHVEIPLSRGIRINLNADNITGARYLSSIDRYGLPAIVSASITFPLDVNHEAGSQPACS